jgi:cyclopropane-fatty-acyl-phospholipid synthase
MQGRLEVEGDLDQALELLYRSASRGGRRSTWLGRLLGAWSAPKPNHLSGSRRNIRHHYDLGNDFYQLWLDPQLVYTCAYFPSPSETLEAAQCAKMELVCRKLGLEPGQRVVEAGCGWGALALYMARKYQVRVRAYNISHEQIAHARQRAQREGLSDRVEFVEEDWRNIRDACDVFVSVGMLEHLGVRHYPILGQVIRKCLRPHGRGLIHSIGQTHPCLLNPWIERRIFPGAYPPTLRQIMDILEPSDLAVLDVENLRLHYAETLRHWRQRFEAASDRIRAGYGASFVRMWRLYLAGSTAAFQTGALHLFQVLFSLDSNNAIPWTRSSLYQSPLA